MSVQERQDFNWIFEFRLIKSGFIDIGDNVSPSSFFVKKLLSTLSHQHNDVTVITVTIKFRSSPAVGSLMNLPKIFIVYNNDKKIIRPKRFRKYTLTLYLWHYFGSKFRVNIALFNFIQEKKNEILHMLLQ